MSFRPVIAIAAALLCTTAFAQSDVPAQAASSAPVASSSSTPADAATTATGATGAATATVAADVPVKPGDAEAGKAKAGLVCAACHGMDGNSTNAMYPRLAGQSERYIVDQLKAFKSRARESAIMFGMASQLSVQDMHDIGAYYAEQTPKYGVADEALVQAGEALYRGGDPERGIPACMACHGPAGGGNAGAPYPHLAGQYADYVQTVLQAWKDGTTWGDDAHSKIMPSIAKRLSSDDIAALATYIEGLHPATAGDAP